MVDNNESLHRLVETITSCIVGPVIFYDGVAFAYLIDAWRYGWCSNEDDIRGKLRCPQDLQGLMKDEC